MNQLLVFLVLLCSGQAVDQDLSGKVFSFPLDKGTSHVQLMTGNNQPMTALTVCMRFFSSVSRAQSLFSLALESNDNAFLLYKPSVGVYRLHVMGTALNIQGLPDDLSKWNSVCWTWDSSTGVTTLWVNNKRSARQILQQRASLNGVPSIILGQEQDRYGGGFDQSQSFVGDLTDVHLWDRVIPACDIRMYMEGNPFTPGNLLSWTNLQYVTSGSVYVETSDFDKLHCSFI